MKTYLRSIWLTGFLVGAVAIAATACGSDDDDDGGGTGGKSGSGGSSGTGGGNTGGKSGSGGGNTGGSSGSGGGNTGGSSGSGGGNTGGAAGDGSGGTAGDGSGGSAGGGDAGAAGGGGDALEAALARCPTDFDMLSSESYSAADFCLVYNATCSPASATECESFAAEGANTACRSYHVCNAVRDAAEDNMNGVMLHCGHANGEPPCADM